jgi:hypothetical protein
MILSMCLEELTGDAELFPEKNHGVSHWFQDIFPLFRFGGRENEGNPPHFL